MAETWLQKKQKRPWTEGVLDIERRWDNAVDFSHGSFNNFWSERLKGKRDLLIIIGLGWDPRMSALLGLIKEFGGEGHRLVHEIHFSPSPTFESPYREFIENNGILLNNVASGWADIERINITTRKEGNFYIGDDEIRKFYREYDLGSFSDILVDISALPKSLFFTLLLILVKKVDLKHVPGNIHVVACQDVELDHQITESADDTRILKGFKGKFGQESKKGVPIIWSPVLARNKAISLSKLYDAISPKDIYPILPFPAKDPRSDDDLLIEYRQIFASEWNLNPLNMIYAAEDDPLDVYRSLFSLYEQQEDALSPLGGITMVVSALSSKISSIGVFMAAYEKNMAVMHPIGHHDPPSTMTLNYWSYEKMQLFKENLHSIWLAGEPYV
jgi:hypothetical protein